MNLALPAGTQVPTEPGTPFEGGFYVGRIRVGDQLCALIVAPKAQGETTGKWQRKAGDEPDARSFFDGATNTAAMSLAGSSIATWAMGLSINGFDDWHLPSRDELELLYRHLKPTTQANWRWRGDNPSSVPPGYPYSAESPLQTSVPAFQAGGAEAMEPDWYWSSTQYSRDYAWSQSFDDGFQSYFDGKSYEGRARAVRRLVIQSLSHS